MGVFTEVGTDAMRAFVASYGLGDLVRFEGIPAGSVNSNFGVELSRTRYFVRVYEEQDFAGAEAEARLLTVLERGGVPTPAPLVGTDGAHIRTLVGKPAALFPWRDGAMRCQASVTPEDTRKVGVALAKVHVVGAGAERPRGRFRIEDLFERLDRIARAEDPTHAALAAPLRAKLEEARDARDATLPRGLIHGDLFRDNVLWDDRGGISALLDFESASDGVFAYDLAVTMLAFCVGDALDWSLARALCEGYESVRPLESTERHALRTEARVAALRFTITRITDYAMRSGGVGPRVLKDYRRFLMRYDAVSSLDDDTFCQCLGLTAPSFASRGLQRD
jgi:homoserine kinase type II